MPRLTDKIITQDSSISYLQRIAEIARLEPSHAALRWEENNKVLELSFSQLEKQSTQLAIYLQKHGIKPVTQDIDLENVTEQVIAIAVDRTQHYWVLAALACWKIGAAVYLLDLELTEKDLKQRIKTANCYGLIRSETMPDYDYDWKLNVTWEELKQTILSPSIPANPEFKAFDCPQQYLRYIVFSSGSSGYPKAIALPEAVVNPTLNAYDRAFKLTKNDVILQASKVSFDVIWAELFLLGTGATLLLVNNNKPSIETLIEYANKHKVTIANFVPSFLQQIKPTALPTLRGLVSTGEKASKPLFDKWLHRKEGTKLNVVNGYGPSECIGASLTCYEGDIVDISNSFPGTTIYLLDKQNKPVAEGKPGLIAIEAIGLARGYVSGGKILKHNSLTWIKGLDKNNPERVIRVFKTADLAKREDKKLLFQCRVDNVIKYHGRYIDLNGLAVILQELIQPACRDLYPLRGVYVFPVYEGNSEAETKELCYFSVVLITEQNKWKLSIADVLQAIYERMGYRLPLQFNHLTERPEILSDNHKIKPKMYDEFSAKLIPIQLTKTSKNHELEDRVIELWYQVLKLSTKHFPIDATTPFCQLGADSLHLYMLLNLICKTFSLKNLPKFKLNMTAANMAHEIAQLKVYSSAWLSLDGMDVIEKDQPVIFLCPPATGSCQVLGSDSSLLQRVFPTEQPQYGLDLVKALLNPLIPGYIRSYFLESEATEMSLTDMARYALYGMQNIQKRGPYFLAGYSTGAILAYEIAYLMQQNYQKIAWLGLFDLGFPLLVKNSFKTEPKRIEAQLVHAVNYILQLSLKKKPTELTVSSSPSAVNNLSEANQTINKLLTLVDELIESESSEAGAPWDDHLKNKLQIIFNLVKKMLCAYFEFTYRQQWPVFNNQAKQVHGYFTDSQYPFHSLKDKITHWESVLTHPLKFKVREISGTNHWELLFSDNFRQRLATDLQARLGSLKNKRCKPKKALSRAKTPHKLKPKNLIRLHWKLPKRPLFFSGRTKELTALQEFYLNASQNTLLVHGFSGIGKSKLIHEFCQKIKSEYKNIFIIYFDCPDLRNNKHEHIEQQVRAEMKELLISIFNLKINEELTGEQLVDIFYSTLRERARKLDKVLIVFDNVQSNESIRKLLKDTDSEKVKIIVCSTKTDKTDFYKKIKLSELTPEDSNNYIKTRLEAADSYTRPVTVESIQRIAEHFCYYPLALNQAIGCCIVLDLTLEEFLLEGKAYERNELFKTSQYLLSGDNYKKTMSKAVYSSVCQLMNDANNNGYLKQLLALFALLSTKPVPLPFLLHLFNQLHPFRTKERELKLLCNKLVDYGYIENHDNSYTMHGAIQAVLFGLEDLNVKTVIEQLSATKFLADFSVTAEKYRYYSAIESHLHQFFEKKLYFPELLNTNIVHALIQFLSFLTFQSETTELAQKYFDSVRSLSNLEDTILTQYTITYAANIALKMPSVSDDILLVLSSTCEQSNLLESAQLEHASALLKRYRKTREMSVRTRLIALLDLLQKKNHLNEHFMAYAELYNIEGDSNFVEVFSLAKQLCSQPYLPSNSLAQSEVFKKQAELFSIAGNFSKALQYIDSSLLIVKTFYADDNHPEVLDLLDDKARILVRCGQYSEAYRLRETLNFFSLKTCLRLSIHLYQISQALYDLACWEKQINTYASETSREKALITRTICEARVHFLSASTPKAVKKAIGRHERSLVMNLKKHNGNSHVPNIMLTKLWLADALVLTSDYTRANTLLMSLISESASTYGQPNNAVAAKAYYYLAAIKLCEGLKTISNDRQDIDESQKMLQQSKKYVENSLAIFKELCEDMPHPDLATAIKLRAQLSFLQGNYKLARLELRKTLVMEQLVYPTDNQPEIHLTLAQLASVEQASFNNIEAAKYLLLASQPWNVNNLYVNAKINWFLYPLKFNAYTHASSNYGLIDIEQIGEDFSSEECQNYADLLSANGLNKQAYYYFKKSISMEKRSGNLTEFALFLCKINDYPAAYLMAIEALEKNTAGYLSYDKEELNNLDSSMQNLLKEHDNNIEVPTIALAFYLALRCLTVLNFRWEAFPLLNQFEEYSSQIDDTISSKLFEISAFSYHEKFLSRSSKSSKTDIKILAHSSDLYHSAGHSSCGIIRTYCKFPEKIRFETKRTSTSALQKSSHQYEHPKPESGAITIGFWDHPVIIPHDRKEVEILQRPHGL